MDSYHTALRQGTSDSRSGDLKAEPSSLLQPATFEAPARLRIGTDKAGVKPPGVKKGGLRRLLLLGAGLAVLGGGSYFGRDYWLVGRFHVSTDDAYVQADTVTIAPKVPGYLTEVLVGDNDGVKAGQVLARIHARDYTAALDQTRADVAAA